MRAMAMLLLVACGGGDDDAVGGGGGGATDPDGVSGYVADQKRPFANCVVTASDGAVGTYDRYGWVVDLVFDGGFETTTYVREEGRVVSATIDSDSAFGEASGELRFDEHQHLVYQAFYLGDALLLEENRALTYDGVDTDRLERSDVLDGPSEGDAITYDPCVFPASTIDGASGVTETQYHTYANDCVRSLTEFSDGEVVTYDEAGRRVRSEHEGDVLTWSYDCGD